jgi:hypothetical protein
VAFTTRDRTEGKPKLPFRTVLFLWVKTASNVYRARKCLNAFPGFSNLRGRASTNRAPLPVTFVPTSLEQNQFGFHATQNSSAPPQFISRTSHSEPSCAAQHCCVILGTSVEQTASLGHIVGA